MPFAVHGIHESGDVGFGVCMLDSVVVGMTKNTRRLRPFRIVATCTLFDVFSGKIGVATATAAISSSNGKSRNSVACRESATQSLRPILVAIIAECPCVMAGLTFDRLRLCVNAMSVQVIDIVDRLSCERFGLVVPLLAGRNHSNFFARSKFGQV